MRIQCRAACALIAAVAVLTGCTTATSPSSLSEGDCFDVPTAATIASIPTRPCTEPHGGEVFHVFDVTAESGAYPSDDAWGRLIYPVCDPAFQAYTGTGVETRTDIDYTYLVPTADRWAAGERRVTCFIKSLDGAPLRRSERKLG